MNWYEISPQLSQETTRYLTVGEVEFQDKLLNFIPNQEEVLQFFNIVQKGVKPLSYNFDMVPFQLRYEMSPHRKIIKRNVYHALELLGDVGGL